MTGEITLRGRVLKIGGLKEKVLAAHRAHIKNIIIPQENEDDLEDISRKIRRDLNFTLVENVDQVLDAALLSKEGSVTGQTKRGRSRPRVTSGKGN